MSTDSITKFADIIEDDGLDAEIKKLQEEANVPPKFLGEVASHDTVEVGQVPTEQVQVDVHTNLDK